MTTPSSSIKTRSGKKNQASSAESAPAPAITAVTTTPLDSAVDKTTTPAPPGIPPIPFHSMPDTILGAVSTGVDKDAGASNGAPAGDSIVDAGASNGAPAIDGNTASGDNISSPMPDSPVGDLWADITLEELQDNGSKKNVDNTDAQSVFSTATFRTNGTDASMDPQRQVVDAAISAVNGGLDTDESQLDGFIHTRSRKLNTDDGQEQTDGSATRLTEGVLRKFVASGGNAGTITRKRVSEESSEENVSNNGSSSSEAPPAKRSKASSSKAPVARDDGASSSQAAAAKKSTAAKKDKASSSKAPVARNSGASSSKAPVARDGGASSSQALVAKAAGPSIATTTEMELKHMSADAYIDLLVKGCQSKEDVHRVLVENNIEIIPLPVQRLVSQPVFVPSKRASKTGEADKDKSRQVVRRVGENIFGFRIFSAGTKLNDHAYVAHQEVLSEDHATVDLSVSDSVKIPIYTGSIDSVQGSLTPVARKRLQLVSKYLSPQEVQRLLLDTSGTMLRDRFVIIIQAIAELFGSVVSFLEIEEAAQRKHEAAMQKATQTGKRKMPEERKLPKLSKEQQVVEKFLGNAQNRALASEMKKFFGDANNKELLRKIKYIGSNVNPSSIFPEDLEIIVKNIDFDPKAFEAKVDALDETRYGITKIILRCMIKLGYIKNGFYSHKNAKFPAEFFINSQAVAACKSKFDVSDDMVEYGTRMKGMVTTLECTATEILTRITSHVKAYLNTNTLKVGAFVGKEGDKIAELVKSKLHSDQLNQSSLSTVVDSSIPRAFNGYSHSAKHIYTAPNQLYIAPIDFSSFKDLEILREDGVFPKIDMPTKAKDPEAARQQRLANLEKGRQTKLNKRAGAPAQKKARTEPAQTKEEKKEGRKVMMSAIKEGTQNFGIMWEYMITTKPNRINKNWNKKLTAVYNIYLLYKYDLFVQQTVMISRDVTMLDGTPIKHIHDFTLSPKILQKTFNELVVMGIHANIALKMMRAVVPSVRKAFGEDKVEADLDFKIMCLVGVKDNAETLKVSKFDALKLALNIPYLTEEEYSRVAPVFFNTQKRMYDRFVKWVEVVSGVFERPLSKAEIGNNALELVYNQVWYARAESYVRKILFFARFDDKFLLKKINTKKAVAVYKATDEYKAWNKSTKKNFSKEDKERELNKKGRQYCIHLVHNIQKYMVPTIEVTNEMLSRDQFTCISGLLFDIRDVEKEVEKRVEHNESLCEDEDPVPFDTIESYTANAEERYAAWLESVSGKTNAKILNKYFD